MTKYETYSSSLLSKTDLVFLKAAGHFVFSMIPVRGHKTLQTLQKVQITLLWYINIIPIFPNQSINLQHLEEMMPT